MIRKSSSACGLCCSDLCQALETSDRKGRPLQVVVCEGCGVVRNDPIPEAGELAAFYAEEYRLAYKGTVKPKARHAARYFPRAARHIHSHWRHYQALSSVLDLGSGSGEFLFLMKALGKQATGVEPNAAYAAFCRDEYGLDVQTGEIDSHSPERSFEHIRLCHVVEHLADPVSKLRKAASWLAEDGTMYVEVPDFEEYCRRKSPGRIFHYGHIYNFDRDSFDQLVARAGMRIVERTGNTAAFLARDTREGDDTTHRRPTEETRRIYQQHLRSEAAAGTGRTRIPSKLLRLCREQWTIMRHHTHGAIGRHTARQLRKNLKLPDRNQANPSPDAD